MEEIWRDIVGYEGHYQCSNLGRIASIKFGKFLIRKQSPNPNGYYSISAKVNNKYSRIYAARAVARAFPEICGEWFEGCTVDHINTDKSDNRACNLRVVTMKENINNPLTISKMRGGLTEEERKEKRRNWNREWNRKHRDYCIKVSKEWNENHREYLRQKSKEYYYSHLDEIKQYQKEYYKKKKASV